MITLIKIRAQYLFNHSCGIFWVYFFIPVIILYEIRGSFSSEIYNKGIEYTSEEGINLNSSNYVFGGRSLSGSSFALVSDDEEDKNYLKMLNSDIKWTKDENDVDDKHIIKLINKNNKYNIQFKQDTRNSLFYNLLNNVYKYYDTFRRPYRPTYYDRDNDF